MPKIKTKKALAKRVRVTKKGRFKRSKAGRSHILTKKSRKRKRRLRKKGYIDKTGVKIAKRLLPYG